MRNEIEVILYSVMKGQGEAWERLAKEKEVEPKNIINWALHKDELEKQILSEATSQILYLLEGSLPKEKSEDVDDYNESHRYAAATGWNACLEEIKEKMKGKSNE